MPDQQRPNNTPSRVPEDVHSSILFDIARAVQIAPRMLPEDFGPSDRFKLEELIGMGRDSHVYRAVDRHLSKPHRPARVAIKIRASGASTRTEALVGRSVVHDNVVRIIDHGVTDGGEHYMVQELIEGGDLTDLELPLAANNAARLLILIARGTQALHSAGNIHGDLKPSNILQTADGTPKITDFDLASAPDLEEFHQGGNLAFMAPEILLGEHVLPSPLADIYALGGLLYFFVKGTLPHGAEAQEIISNHRRGAAVHMQGVDSDLARICSRALAHNANNRYRSAEALAVDLESWLGKYPIAWTNPSLARRTSLLCRRRPVPIAMGTLAAVAAITSAILVQVIRTRDAEADRRAEVISQAKDAEAQALIRGFVAGGIPSGQLPGNPSIPAPEQMEWLSQLPVFGEEGAMLDSAARIANLSARRDRLRDGGKSGSLADGLAAYALAYIYIEGGKLELASKQLADVEAGMLGALPDSDDMAQSIHALGLLAEFEAALAAGGAEVSEIRNQLQTSLIEFRDFDSAHAVARLIQVVLDRQDR